MNERRAAGVLIGLVRVSTDKQKTRRQHDALDPICLKVFEEKVSGKLTADDRLGRNPLEGLIVLSGLFERGIGVKVLEGIAVGEHTERSLILDLALALAAGSGLRRLLLSGGQTRAAPAVLYPSVSIASVTSPITASGIAVAASLRTSSRAPGISGAITLPLPTGKRRSRRPWTTSVGTSISGRRSRQRGLQSSLENTMPVWLAIWTGDAVPGVRSQMRAASARGDGIVAEDLRAAGGELRNRLAVGPIGHRTREQSAQRRLVMVGEVVVRRPKGDRASADQGERRERARMVEQGHLGNHPADADPREVRRPSAERVSKGRRVGGGAA